MAQEFKKVTTTSGNVSYIAATRAKQLIEKDKAEKKEIAEYKAAGAAIPAVVPTLEKMGIKSISSETYYEHVEAGPGATSVTVYKTEEPTEEIVNGPTGEGSQIARLASAIEGLTGKSATTAQAKAEKTPKPKVDGSQSHETEVKKTTANVKGGSVPAGTKGDASEV